MHHLVTNLNVRDGYNVVRTCGTSPTRIAHNRGIRKLPLRLCLVYHDTSLTTSCVHTMYGSRHLCCTSHARVLCRNTIWGWAGEIESYDWHKGPPPYSRMGGGDDRMHETRLLSFKSFDKGTWNALCGVSSTFIVLLIWRQRGHWCNQLYGCFDALRREPDSWMDRSIYILLGHNIWRNIVGYIGVCWIGSVDPCLHVMIRWLACVHSCIFPFREKSI